ncbi:membrane protein [Actinomadura sp. NBRC 104412]|uniref:helix-turn-helix domain-containing protein n=1 Tax=Actinomadura sp. NBRC 104412 TaxID=3032203 RepID=UPI0024A172EB|nr:RodZ domain-containing protein [Actinomadura sp. NBRC 104412]GLZ04388.1 membrane protein [Actinomadura sp. NBRC 104412]
MSIGETLARERERAGLTLTQVSRQTRIRESVIRAMEQDDFSTCGGNFYARGHIRSVARVIGIDPEPLVREYDDAHGGAPMPLSAVTAFEPERPVEFRERRAPNWSAAMAFALALVLIYGIVQVVNSVGDGERRSAQQVAGTPAAPAPGTTSASPSTTPPKDPVAAAPRDEVELKVKARSTTWVNVRGDEGRQLFSGLLRKGQSREWTDPEKLSILIGNGGGLHVTVNGQDIGYPGSPGSVYRITFTPEDPDSA